MKIFKCFLTILLSIYLFLAGCSDQPSAIADAEKANPFLDNTITTSPSSATVDHQTFTVPFPPIPGVDFAPVPAPCLGLGEPLRMSGTWSGWFQGVTLPNSGSQFTERIDYSEITLKTDDLTWLAGPGASEPIIRKIPADNGESALVIRHEFHARFISQNDKPDLRVSHRVRQLLGPDGELRKNEFEPFTAECIGDN